jgi:kinesin family member 6/9
VLLVLCCCAVINKSLSFLEQVVVALSSKSSRKSAAVTVPFRQSKLTNVLRDSLGGNCKTRLIANIWGEKKCLEETISTLKFATRMMKCAADHTHSAAQLQPTH